MNSYKIIGDDGREYGPVDLATVRAWVAEGRVDAGTQVLVVGTTAWKSAWRISELGVGAPATPRPLPAASKSMGSMRSTSAREPQLRRSDRRERRSAGWRVLAVLGLLIAVVVVRVGSIRKTRTRFPQNRAHRVQEPVTPPIAPAVEQPDRKEAERGDAEAQFRLGMSYAGRTGKVNEYGEAAKWFRRAADQGHSQAQYQLGRLYQLGLGAARSYPEAAKWYRLAAEQGYAPAQHDLGHLYAAGRGLDIAYLEAPEPPQGGQGMASDYVEAAKWWRKAAEQGDARAEFDLGWLYSVGRGVDTDYVEAAAWYRKSAEQGNPGAQYQLGHCLRMGRGVAQDEVEALSWFRKAAEAGLASAQNSYAWMLATSTNASLRDGALAMEFAQKAVKATQRSNGSFLDTLAAAHAEAGEFDQAVAVQKEAIAVEKDSKFKQEYEVHLQRYEAKSPFREVPNAAPQ